MTPNAIFPEIFHSQSQPLSLFLIPTHILLLVSTIQDPGSRPRSISISKMNDKRESTYFLNTFTPKQLNDVSEDSSLLCKRKWLNPKTAGGWLLSARDEPSLVVPFIKKSFLKASSPPHCRRSWCYLNLWKFVAEKKPWFPPRLYSGPGVSSSSIRGERNLIWICRVLTSEGPMKSGLSLHSLLFRYNHGIFPPVPS